MRARINKSRAWGSVNAPGSKSMAHRLLICAGMADGVSVIHGITPSADVLATIRCLRALGVDITRDGDTYTVVGTDMRKTAPCDKLFCDESGSTLRFMIPIATLSGARVCFSGAKSLLARPLSVYEEIYAGKDLLFHRLEDILYVDGPLMPGDYTVRGDISSQFISGLLFALPVLDEDSTIRITPPLESRSYIKMTLDALSYFGVKAEFSDEYTISIRGNQKYTPGEYTVEGDYSGAAFLDAFNYLEGQVEVKSLSDASSQGDKVYRDLFPLIASGECPEINIEDCPDLAPILMALAAYYSGAHFTGTRRLRIKESNRADAMNAELSKLGAEITVLDNEIIVHASDLHAPLEPINSHNDHRIVMSMAVLLSKFGGEIVGAEAVSKSYPDFFCDISMLGIEVKLYD